MTYSIVARDASSGQMGVAVQSHWFSVGSVCTWGEAGVGVVATQAFAEASYGPRGLDLMRRGMTAAEALDALVAVDAGAARRQVAMVDAGGVVAVHTGEMCIAEAAHEMGEGFSVQANMMLNDTVPAAMASAFSSAEGDLAERMLGALDAAEGEGGDIRGRQSGALLVVRGEPATDAADGRVIELRVPDHPDPLGELRRLNRVKGAYDHMNAGDTHLAAGETEAALAEYEAAQAAVPDNVEFAFWCGVTLASVGKMEDAKPFMERAFAGEGEWRELLRRLPRAGLLDSETVGALL